MDAQTSDGTRTDRTRSFALTALVTGIFAIAIGYAGAFSRGGTPVWAPWFLALGIPAALGSIMVLGAARGSAGVGPLKIPFAFVVIVLALGFGAAIAMPATESALSRLWLGLPARAAIVIYGIGLLPIVVLPVAYAVTFKTQTLDADDIEKVRAAGQDHARFLNQGPGGARDDDPRFP